MQRFTSFGCHRQIQFEMKSKYLFTIWLLVLSVFQSCKKDNASKPQLTDIPLCVQRVNYSFTTQGPTVTDAQMDTVKTLFSSNNLSLNHLQIYSVINESKYEIIHVYCNQFINGLLIFGGDTGFHFRKGLTGYLLEYMPSNLIKGTVNIDSLHKSSPLHAANVLYQKITDDLQYYSGSSGWADSCYNVTLGIISTAPNSPNETNYKLTWKITPENNEYPYCIVNALSGALEYYNDGIIN